MKIHGNDIVIHRGETFTLSMNVKMRDGTPFIMTYDPDNDLTAHNPYILITIASSKYAQKGSYIKNWWLPMNDLPSFTSTEIKTLTNLEQTSSDSDNERYLYYNQQDGKYYYYNGNNFKEYAFKIYRAFLYEETNELVSQSYYYSVTYVDGPNARQSKVIKYMREDWTNVTGSVLDIDTYILQNSYQAAKDFYLDMCKPSFGGSDELYAEKTSEIECLETTGPAIVDFTQVTPIISPSKLTVLSNLRGGL